MGLLGLFLSVYFILLLVRALVPDTGQMAFNQPYRLVVKLTEPVIAFTARLLPPRARSWAVLPAIGAIILLQAFIDLGESGPRAGTFIWGFSEWRFIPGRAFWGVGSGLAHYLVLSYRIFTFLILVVLISPEGAGSNQVFRLVKTLLQPLFSAVRSRRAAAAALPLLFTLLMALLWRFYQAAGWLGPEGGILGRSLVNSLAIPLQLSTLIIYLIFFRAVLSWFDGARRSSGPLAWVELLAEPFLRPLRRFNLTLGGIDLTPLAAIFAILAFRGIAGAILREVSGPL